VRGQSRHGGSVSIFFRGHFTDYEKTFETIGEPDYTVELITDADDVGVLLSKDWFEWGKPLTAGTRLIFCLRSEVTYKDKVNLLRARQKPRESRCRLSPTSWLGKVGSYPRY